jgi:tripartite-type tricarboxylate transporter receptor subunit TctC
MIQQSPLRHCLSAILLIALSAISTWAAAQKPAHKADAWPTKPVRLMVGFPAGTSPDLVARTLAEPLTKLLGQPVIVENKPGAGGNIAADLVAKSSDGHTFGVMINGNLTIAKLLNSSTPFDPATDLAPISLIATAPLVLSAPVTPTDPSGDFFQAARKAGNSWSYGSPGVGTVGHIGMELLKAKAGIDPVHVPYPGYPQVVTAMIGGQIQVALLPPGLALIQARAGKVKTIGVTSSGRSVLAPEVPSLSEAGIRDYQLEIWNGVAGPATTPPAVVARLSALLSEIVRSPEVRQKLFAQGWQVAGSSAEGLANRMRTDTAVLGKIIRERAITAQ